MLKYLVACVRISKPGKGLTCMFVFQFPLRSCNAGISEQFRCQCEYTPHRQETYRKNMDF